MLLTDRTVRRVAELLCESPETIERDRLRRALHAVEHRTRDYSDALHYVGQIPGNVVGLPAAAIVYDYLD